MAVENRWGDPGTPGSAAELAWRKANLVTIHAGGIVLAVHRELAVIFTDLVNELTAAGMNLAKVADDWGYANRPIRGGTAKSFHATGQAVDLDAQTNPMGPASTTFPIFLTHRLCAKLGLRWGFDYTGRKDSMHFEFIGTIADARRITRQLQLARVAAKVAVAARTVVRAVQRNPYPQPARLVGPGGLGAPVQWVQWALGLNATGRYDAATAAAVRRFQSKQRLLVDGVVGPMTRTALSKVTR